MIDHDRELLKWVAEELLGWTPAPKGNYQHTEGRLIGAPSLWTKLQSWHGIGLVVEEMERREWYFQDFSRDILKDNKGGRFPAWSANFKREGQFEGENFAPAKEAWFAVYEAARKAVKI